MIDVQRLYERVKDLSRKDKSGYTDPDEFNRGLQQAEELLMSYYIARTEQTQEVPESLAPFIDYREGIPILSRRYIQRPSDMRYVVEVYVGYPEKIGCETKIRYGVADAVTGREVGTRAESLIRTSPRYFYENRTIAIEPPNIYTLAKLRYVRNPVYGVYGYTTDFENDRILYDANTSKQPEWLIQDENNILDLLLTLKGIETRDSILMQWVARNVQQSQTQ